MVKKYLFTGLLIWVPLGITLWVLSLFVGLMDQSLMLLPDALHPRVLFGVHIPGLGIILTGAVLLVTGMVAANYFGAWVFRTGDWVLSRIPLFNIVYNSVKQVSDTLLSSSGKAFSQSVLVPYPHAGVWALGLTPFTTLPLNRPHKSVACTATGNVSGTCAASDLNSGAFKGVPVKAETSRAMP